MKTKFISNPFITFTAANKYNILFQMKNDVKSTIFFFAYAAVFLAAFNI